MEEDEASTSIREFDEGAFITTICNKSLVKFVNLCDSVFLYPLYRAPGFSKAYYNWEYCAPNH